MINELPFKYVRLELTLKGVERLYISWRYLVVVEGDKSKLYSNIKETQLQKLWRSYRKKTLCQTDRNIFPVIKYKLFVQQ